MHCRATNLSSLYIGLIFNNFKVDVDNFHSPSVSKGNYVLRCSRKDRVSNMAPASSLATVQKKQL